MTELSYGEIIKKGDKVKTGKGFHEVIKTDQSFCYVQMNKRATLRMPAVYDKEFKNTDEVDDTTYTVYRG